MVQEDLGKALHENGFNRLAPTLWVLEGLTYYLSEKENASLLTTLGTLSAAGSILTASMVPQSLVDRVRSRGKGLMSTWKWGFGPGFAEVCCSNKSRCCFVNQDQCMRAYVIVHLYHDTDWTMPGGSGSGRLLILIACFVLFTSSSGCDPHSNLWFVECSRSKNGAGWLSMLRTTGQWHPCMVASTLTCKILTALKGKLWSRRHSVLVEIMCSLSRALGRCCDLSNLPCNTVAW